MSKLILPNHAKRSKEEEFFLHLHDKCMRQRGGVVIVSGAAIEPFARWAMKHHPGYLKITAGGNTVKYRSCRLLPMETLPAEVRQKVVNENTPLLVGADGKPMGRV